MIKSDTTENYELGAKFNLLDNRLTLNAAVFRIDWTDLAVFVEGNNAEGCNAFIFANLGEARSEGIELEANYAVSSNLLLNLSAAYLDARLTESPLLDVPDAEDELAHAPNNASLGLEYSFELGDYPAFVRSDISYVSDYRTDIALAQQALRGGDYVKTDLRLGVSIDSFSLAVYAKNLTNEDDILLSSRQGGPAGIAFRLPPRRIGLSLSYDF